jgi:hypothetical protein
MLRTNLEKRKVVTRVSSVPLGLSSLRGVVPSMGRSLARTLLAVACLFGCSDPSDTSSLASPGPSGAMESKSPPRLPSSTATALQNGSGGIPAPLGCDGLAPEACEKSLRQGFGITQTPLVLTASECVPASAVDPSLDDSTVCRCEFASVNYSSDMGDMSSSAYTIGLARLRATASATEEGCELWFQNDPETGICLLESRAFSGCSLADAAGSCQSSCQALATHRAQAVATQTATVEVVAASCVRCNWDHCLGVMQIGSRCFLGMQSSLGYGYYPQPIACDASVEEQLQQSGLQQCSLYTDGSAQPLPTPAGGPGDAGLPGDAGASAANRRGG